MNHAQRVEAGEARAKRATLTNAFDRIALDNQPAKTSPLPVGLLIMALELEERKEVKVGDSRNSP